MQEIVGGFEWVWVVSLGFEWCRVVFCFSSYRYYSVDKNKHIVINRKLLFFKVFIGTSPTSKGNKVFWQLKLGPLFIKQKNNKFRIIFCYLDQVYEGYEQNHLLRQFPLNFQNMTSARTIILTNAFYKYPIGYTKYYITNAMIFPISEQDYLNYVSINSFDCMFLPCHVRVSEWIHTL